ncbi:MAG: hypothetical protein N2258_00050 [Brevinematales bacterium]|nr:hypothetical protein [Brevinematales bacterium]
MRKILFGFSLLMCVGFLYSADFDTMTNEMSGVLRDTAKKISGEMKKHMGFFTGSGNITPVNTSGFPGLKFGLGGGVMLNSVLFQVMANPNYLDASDNKNEGELANLSKVMSTFPIPYNEVYGKIGIPLLPLDVGLRLGYMPRIEMGGADAKVGADQFHFGVEGRYLIFKDPTGILKLDTRLSVDFDYGNVLLSGSTTQAAYANDIVIGTNKMTATMSYSWGGSSIGLKLLGAADFFVVSVFAGLGLNLNVGEVNTKLGVKNEFIPTLGPTIGYELTGESKMGYDIFDLRLLIGTHLLFIDIGYEYGILSGDMAFTIIPIAIAF